MGMRVVVGGGHKHLNAPATVAPNFSTSLMAAFIVPPVSIHWSTSSTFIPAGGDNDFSFQSVKVFIGTEPVDKYQFHQHVQKSMVLEQPCKM